MQTDQPPQTNFGHLEIHEPQLVRLGMLAERYFAEDPNTCLLKLRQFAEVLAQLTASKVGVFVSDEGQYDLLRRLADHGIVPREISQLFAEVRRAGNAASHSMAGDHRTALICLKISWQLEVWFHRTFKDASFRSGPFVPPRPPADESAELKSELARLRSELDHHRASSTQVAGQLASAE
jgi:type I restriction enzyme R subunit